MPSNETNSATNPGRKLITLATTAAISVIAIILLGAMTAQAQSGAVPNLELSSASPGALTISWDAPDPAPSDYRIIWAKQDLDFPLVQGSIQRLFNERYFRFETVPSSPTVGGNIHLENCCYLDRLYAVSEWDSNYDGAAIFDFYTGWGESGSSRWVTITPGNSMRPNIWFYGEYTLTLTDVTGLQRLVSNTNQRGAIQVFALVGKNIALEVKPKYRALNRLHDGQQPQRLHAGPDNRIHLDDRRDIHRRRSPGCRHSQRRHQQARNQVL